MALVTKEITRLLTEATEKRSIPSLNEAFRSLKQLVEQRVIVDNGKTMQASSDLYLFVFEAAVLLEQWDVAQHCADRLVESTTTTRAFQIRTLYCRAALDVESTRSLRGRELIVCVQAALAKIVAGMKMALQDTSQLSHLVALGSRHIWNVGRSLFKDGTYVDVVATIGFTVAALEKVDFQDWHVRVTWLLRYATALAGASKLNEANATLQKASDLTTKYLPHMKLAVFRMQVAMSRLVANPKVKQDAAKGVLRAVYASNAVFCGLLEGPAADSELSGAFAELNADVAPSSPLDPSKSAKPTLPPAANPGKKEADNKLPADDMAVREEVFAELGLALALHGDIERASECAKAALRSRGLKSRVFGEYTSSLVKATACGGMAVQHEANANTLTPHMIAELAAAVRDIDRTIESAQRLPDTSDRNHLVQYGCVLVWNVALPLLQPATRGQIARSLQNTAKHLEDIQSNMLTLRTLLYYEAALTDVDSDYLNKATTKIEKALGMDYPPDAEDQRVYNLMKPLDRFLVWLKHKLDVRSNLYTKPDNVEDEALIIVEQAKGAPLVNRLSMLTRAVNMLQDSEPPQDYFVDTTVPVAKADDGKKDSKKGATPAPAKKGGAKGADGDDEASSNKLDPVMEAHRNHLRTRSALWHAILTCAWVEKADTMLGITRQAATALISRTWVRRGDRDMRQMQADAHFAVAESAVVELRRHDLFAAQRTFFAADASDDEDDEDHGPDDAEAAEHHRKPAAKSAKAKGAKSSNGLPAFVGDEQALAKRVEELTAIVGACETTLLQSLVDGAKIGVDLVQQGYEDAWIVANAATLMWNFHTRAFAESRDFLTPLPGLEQLYHMMLTVQLDPKKETSLIRDVAFSYCQGLVQQYVKDKLAADPANASMSQNALAIAASRANVATFGKIEANNGKLLKAAEVCDKMIAMLPTPMEAKGFLMYMVSILRLLGKPLDQRPHPQQRLLMILEQLKQPLGVEEKRTLLNNTAVDLLTQDPNVELCARLAAASLALPDNDRITVRVASIGAQLYSDGRLGWKQSDMAAAVNTTNAKGAKGGATKAADAAAQLAAATPSPSTDPPPPPAPEDWHWYALLMQYQAIALSQLVNPVVQEKPTQLEIRHRALISLTNSAMAAVQGLGEYRGETIRKALHLYRGMCQEFTGDAMARSYVLPSLRQLLSDKIIRHATLSPFAPLPSVPSDMDILQDLYVLFLLCLRDAEEDEEGLLVLKTAMKCLPASHHRPFWGFDIQFRCAAGLPTNQTLLRVKEYAPEIQAQVWVVFSKYATSVEDQRFAMQSAVDVLGEKPVEQAAHMLLFAQWMLQTNYSVTLEVVVDLIVSAVDLVGGTIDTEAEEDIGTDMASSAGGPMSRNASMSGKSLSGATAKAKTVGSRSAASLQGHAKKKSDRSRASIRALKVALEAYYILSRICGHAPVSHGAAGGATFGTSLIGAKSALAMVVHYVMRIFATTIASANSHNHRQKAKILKAQRVAAANGGSVTPGSDVSAIPSDFDVPASAHGWIGFSLSSQVVDTLKEMRTPSAVSPSSIGNAESFVAVLEDVVAMLMREGMELQAHPVLQLMKLVIEVCLPPGQALAKSAVNCANASLFTAASAAGVGSLAVVYRVTDPYVAPNDLLALREDARIALERKGTAGDEPTAAKVPVATVSLKEPAPSHMLHKFWAALSRSMLLEGRVTAARTLVGEAKYHAVAYGDDATAATCAWIEAQIEFLEGRVEHSLELIRDCLDAHAAHVCAHTWVDMKLFELDVLLAVGRLEDAMRTATIAAGMLEQQVVFCTGLAKDVADHVTPELRSILLLRFSGMAVKALSTPSSRGHESIATLRQELVTILKRAMDSVIEVPTMQSQLYLLQVELSKLEAETIPVEPSHRALATKKRLCQEARWLSRAIDAAKEQVSFALHLESASAVSLPTPMSQVGGMLCALGHNLMDRVELNMQLLQTLRGSDYTTLQFPKVEGAAQDVESNVVYFMRSTRKQRAADRRKEQRKGARRLIEERREIARSERQQEIDKRREQRKLEAEASQLAGKKDPKAKPAPKGSAVVVEEPDVDPNDKCGIPSPDGSEDEGHGEDSQSDEEEELRLALRDLSTEDLETESRLSYSDVEACFLAAAEVGGELSTTSAEAKFGLAVALMRSYEASTIGAEQREALLKGEQRSNTALSKSLVAKWQKPIEMPTEEDTAAKGKKKEADAKKPAPKAGAKDAAAVVAVVPATPVDPKQLAESQTIRVFTAQLEAAVAQATALSDVPLLRRALLAYGNALVLSGQYQAAALAVECSQAHSMAAYVTDLWKTAAHPDATEVALLSAIDHIENHAPHLKISPHYNEVIKAAASASRMAARIKPASPAWGQPSVHEVAPFSQDVCCFTATQANDRTWLVVLRRPSGAVDVRRVDLAVGDLMAHQQNLMELESARTTLLTSDRPDQVLLADNSNQIRACADQLFQLLDQLWQPFQPLIDVLGPKTHVVLCVDPELHALPLEWSPALAKFISVQRELSAAVAAAKVQRRVVDKYVGTTASLIVDPRRECPGSVAAILGADEKPKIAGWQLVSALVDENKQLRYPSVAQMQRVLSNTAVSSAVVDMCGRFTSLFGISALATLNLDHIRAMVLMDRGAKEVSYRRENQSDMQKTQRQLWAESSWNTALLLLARGVEFAVVNRNTAAPAVNDLVCRIALSNMEKPQVRSFTEVLMQPLRKPLQEDAARSDVVGTPVLPKAAADATTLMYADCVNVAFYGLSFDEPIKTGK